jgi:hypothetical protein
MNETQAKRLPFIGTRDNEKYKRNIVTLPKKKVSPLTFLRSKWDDISSASCSERLMIFSNMFP